MTIALAASPPTQTRPGLHQILRDGTKEAHERLHQHAGFLAVKNGTISSAAYRALLTRLYGFHLPFETAVNTGTDRSCWLLADLAFLGTDAGSIARIELCDDLPRLRSSNRQLGALYVIEGSALGGLSLGRGLDHLFGSGSIKGRQFFMGRAKGTAPAWNSLLARLAAEGAAPSARDEIVTAAVEVFDVFENWMSHWGQTEHG